jgi:ATP-dependent 26S proteasome regulatory subunit
MASITAYLKASYPALFIRSFEEGRIRASVIQAAAAANRELFVWTHTEGLAKMPEGTKPPQGDALADPQALLDWLCDDGRERAVVLALDFHLHLRDAAPILLRRLKDAIIAAKQHMNCLILGGVGQKLPPELEKEITFIDLPLPTPDELREIVQGIVTMNDGEVPAPSPELERDLLRAAGGLTSIEAENAFTLSIIEHRKFVPAVVAREKAQALKKNGILEVIETSTGLDAIGGLEPLKEWLRQRTRVFSTEAAAYGLPSPRGCLVGGVPGSGKSLTAKAAASILEVLLLRLDAGRLFGSLVGETEQNLRQMIEIAEAAAPCVLWIDEFEKAFAGSQSSGSTDGGTTARMFGAFLTWMQEKKAAVFIFATCNNVAQLPPELLRKGRWDELWFVDLPTQSEREAIWRVQIKKHGRKPEDFDVETLAAMTEKFVGAEIEQMFVESLFLAFDQGKEPTTDMLRQIIVKTVPMSDGMAEQIRYLRERLSALARPASAPEPVAAKTHAGPGRKLALGDSA